MFKTVIATAILGLGIAGAYFVIQNPDMDSKTALTEESGNLPKSSPFVEKISNSKNTSGKTVFEPKANLTDDFINGLKQDVAENNIDNDSKNLVISDPEQIADDLLTEAYKKFIAQRMKSIVDNSRIKTTDDNSKQSLLNYVKAFQDIIIKGSAQVPASVFSSDPTPETIEPLIGIYALVIEEYYQMKVPTSAVLIHKKQIELASRKKRVFEEILNYQSDPVTAILASDELEKIDQEIYGFNAKFYKFVESI